MNQTSNDAEKLLRINVRQVAQQLDDPSDEGAAGVYAVIFNFDTTGLSDQKRASIALDIFHAHQGIECLDDFAIDVIDSTGNLIGQDETHEDYSCSDAGDVEKVSDTAFQLRDEYLLQVGRVVPVYDPFEVLGKLLNWAAHMGGWEAPCWTEASQLMEQRRTAEISENVSEDCFARGENTIRTDAVAALIARCGDKLWGECEQFPRGNWSYAVLNEDTILGYWEWVYNEAATNSVDHNTLTGRTTT